MNPRVFLDSFWRNDIKDEVFVAMDFDDRFKPRWDNIFRPAIEEIDGWTLKAVRVDNRRSGDSILSEIINGIAHSQLVIADISVTSRWKEGADEKCCRNGNVMYEVGLALACRQPVEVVLVRDDSEKLLFDISHIPVIRFNPGQQFESKQLIHSVIKDRLRERDFIKDLRVSRAAERLTQFELNVIRAVDNWQTFWWTGDSLPSAVAIALPTLLEKDIFRLVEPGGGENPTKYGWTTLGRATARRVLATQDTPNTMRIAGETREHKADDTRRPVGNTPPQGLASCDVK